MVCQARVTFFVNNSATHIQSDFTQADYLARINQCTASKEVRQMQTVSMFQAKTTLSKLVEAVECGREKEIVISRHGLSVAKLVSIARQPVQKRIGVAAGRFIVPDTIDESNELIAKLFTGDTL